MKTLIRSLFLLSLTAAPLALAGGAAPAPTSAISAVSSTADSQSVSVTREETALLRAQVRELEATVDGMRREVARFRNEEDARLRLIGYPDVHPDWP